MKLIDTFTSFVDVSEMAKKSGFKVPIGVAKNLYDRYLMPPEQLRQYGQSLEKRLHEMLCLLRFAQNRQNSKCDEIFFRMVFMMDEKESHVVLLKAVKNRRRKSRTVFILIQEEPD